jgi:hypothetical protein
MLIGTIVNVYLLCIHEPPDKKETPDSMNKIYDIDEEKLRLKNTYNIIKGEFSEQPESQPVILN